MMISEKEKPRMLVVDDEASFRYAVERWFKKHGFDVEEGSNGHEAVTKCSAKEYDVITLDLEMPEMNGADALQAIRKSCPHLPIIILTGYSSNFDSTSLKSANMVLCKPIRLPELEQHVRSVMRVA